MQITGFVRRLSYSPVVGAGIRRLGLRRVMQRAYAALQGNPASVELSLHGITAVFSVRTPHELRCVEGAWFSENAMLAKVVSSLHPGDVFLDVGSNLGLFTIFAAKRVGTDGVVLAFEPETNAYERLLENIRVNRLSNIRPHKMALSQKTGICHLALGDPEAVSQSAHLCDDGCDTEVVECAAFDSLVANINTPVPRVVKMDIEGHEYAALQGMRGALSSPHCTSLFCEIHPRALPTGVAVQEVIGLIQSFGFHVLSRNERFEELHIVATKGPAEPSREELKKTRC
jgi:FkbM family methyltransferase